MTRLIGIVNMTGGAGRWMSIESRSTTASHANAAATAAAAATGTTAATATVAWVQ